LKELFEDERIADQKDNINAPSTDDGTRGGGGE